MSSENTIQLIKNTASKNLLDEIDYHLNDVEHEDETYNYLDAFEDASTIAYNLEDKKMQREILKVEIALGMWKQISDEEIRSAISNGLGIRRKDFPLYNKCRYEFVKKIGEAITEAN